MPRSSCLSTASVGFLPELLFERALKPMPLVSRMLPRCRDLVSRRTVRLVGRCRLTFLHAPDSSVLFGRPIGHRRRRRGR